jgi:hypothetical protein
MPPPPRLTSRKISFGSRVALQVRYNRGLFSTNRIFLDYRMSDSNSASPPSAPRATLKLKVAARKVTAPAKPAPAAQPARQSASKPGAAWSDEYKERMQADMDALAKR